MRVIAALALVMLLASGALAADPVESSVRELGTAKSSYKVRLAAALSLSKSRDPRAVLALARSLHDDKEATVRRIAALALQTMIDAKTAEDAKKLGLDALALAAKSDPDQKVRETATKVVTALSGLRTASRKKNAPAVFVTIDAVLDQSKKLPKGEAMALEAVVKKSVEATGYATTWPGGLPTQAELTTNHAHGYIVASTVKKLSVSTVNGMTQVACTVAVRIAPWGGSDGGERWEANKAASASGSAKATTGTRPKEIEGGMRDCLETVAEDVTTRQVVPFLKKLATAGS